MIARALSSGGSAHCMFTAVKRAGFFAEITILEKLFDLFYGERFKRFFLEFGSRDKFHGTWELKFQ